MNKIKRCRKLKPIDSFRDITSYKICLAPPLFLRSLDPEQLMLSYLCRCQRSTDLVGRTTTIAQESRDPSTNSHGLRKAELLEKVIEFVSPFDTNRDKFFLNLSLCSTLGAWLCYNLRWPLGGVSQPRRPFPPNFCSTHTTTTTSQISRVMDCRDVML